MSATESMAAERALRERVKELTCLYAIAQIAGRPNATLAEILQAVVAALPPAWQSPDLVAARIRVDDTSFSVGPDLGSGLRQQSLLVVRGVARGSVLVGYPQTPDPDGARQFLDEEQSLLDEVARQVSLIIDRRETAAEQERLRGKLLHADRLATLGQLAAGVAHELNEPLGGILGFAQLVAKTPRLPRQAREDVAKIEAAALRARQTIRKLMAFARQTPPRDIPVDINRLIRDGTDLWKPRCDAEGVRLEYALDTRIPEIVADDGQLRQVVTNLVVNSVQAMPNGGVLRIRTELDVEWMRLSVEDSGGGIPAEDAAAVH